MFIEFSSINLHNFVFVFRDSLLLLPHILFIALTASASSSFVPINLLKLRNFFALVISSSHFTVYFLFFFFVIVVAVIFLLLIKPICFFIYIKCEIGILKRNARKRGKKDEIRRARLPHA